MIVTEDLERALASHLCVTGCHLVRLDVSCANPVFRADLSDGRRAFLKLGAPDEMRRTAARLAALAGSPLVPRILIGPSADFAEGRAVCLEWKACRKIEVVDLTDAEADSLADGAIALSRVLQTAAFDVRPADGEDDPARQYGLIRDFAKRYPLVVPLLRGLLNIPVADRSYGTRDLAVIHGDFHALNFGFAEGRFAAVFDFDTLVRGVPCEDLAYALCEDMRRSDLGAPVRRRLLELFERFRSRAPWPKTDWRFAVNHARLRIAARRIMKHPSNPFVAFDVFRRDHLFRPLVAACG